MIKYMYTVFLKLQETTILMFPDGDDYGVLVLLVLLKVEVRLNVYVPLARLRAWR